MFLVAGGGCQKGRRARTISLLRLEVRTCLFRQADGDAAKYSGACHAGLCQGDGPVIGGLAEATQLYHDVGPWSCLGSAIVRC